MHLKSETNAETLRTAALLLEAENQRLAQKVVDLQRQLLKAQGKQPEELQLRLAELERQLAQRTQKIFGQSSERRPPPTTESKPEPKEKQPGHGPRQQDLPEVTKTHDLDPADQFCTQCGGQLTEWVGQFEESEEIDVVLRHFVKVKHLRKKYRCSCHACIETALPPPKLIVGGRYSIEFTIESAIQKYLDHSPLERQVRAMARDGLECDSQTLWDQLNALAQHLDPLRDRLHTYVLRHPLIGADETTWRLMGKGGSARWTVWALCSEDAVFYRLADTKSQEIARELLAGYRGVVIVDGASVYQAVQRKHGGFALAHCWAHVRRKYVEVEKFFPTECGAVLKLIGEMYHVEGQAPPGPEGDAQRKALRNSQSKLIVDQILVWALEVRPRTLPESGLGKAIAYMLNLWPGLITFLSDARIPLDNNATERAQRGIVCGRKNHYGSRSKRGTEVAALLYSLLESCKLVGADPRAYLRAAVEAALAKREIPLPHEFASQLKQAA